MTFEEFKENYQHQEVEEIAYSPPQDPMVSVLVQTYQQKNFIIECLDSILMQETNFNYEILLGDDGSLDGTREICIKYAENFPGKIRVFLHHRENQIKVLGEATSNFNAFYNFFSARGKYIAFCEGDDKWGDPSKLQKQVEFLEKNFQFTLSYHEFNSIDEKSFNIQGVLERDQPRIDLSKEDLLKVSYHPLLVTVCFKKDYVVIPDEIFHVINVDTFLISLFGETGIAKFQDNILPSQYRFRTAGLWSKKLRRKKLISKRLTYKMLASYFERNKKKELKDFYLKQVNLYNKMIFVSHLKHKDFGLAGKVFLKYIRNLV